MTIAGGCLCGATRYRAEGPVSDATLCHCQTCRRASGAPAVAWITVPVERFGWLQAEPPAYRSSPPVTRWFCGRCGTALAYAHRDHPDVMDLTVGSLDRPEDFAPGEHIWVRHRLAWFAALDVLPAHEETRPR